MELFHPFTLIGSKNFFCNMMFMWSNDSKTWEIYFTHFHSSDQHFSLEIVCSFDPRKWNYFTYFHSKTSFRHRKWIFLNRKWNYFTYFKISNQKDLYIFDTRMIQGFQNKFLTQEIYLFNPFPLLWSKNFFRNSTFIWFKDSEISFWSWKWNFFTYFHSLHQKEDFINRKWIYFH